MLAEQIKQDPAISGTVIMMLTSGDRPEDTARCERWASPPICSSR